MLQVDREFVCSGSGSAGAPPPSRSCPCRSAGADPVTWPYEVGLERLAHLYQCEGLSTYRIAELTGSERQRVTRILRRAGVPLRPRGAGGRRPLRRVGDPADLSEVLALLYAHGGLTSGQVGALLGIPERTIRDRLRRYGIQVRSRGRWNREDRRVVPADILLALYSGAGMTAAEVGHLLGISHNVVLRSAHSFGLAVRVGGAVPPSGPEEIELIAALYSDGLVDAALRKHKILRVRAGGPIWERFPEPIPLTRQLVGDLYWGCGVGLNHIELVTGQPAMTVRGFMRRVGMPLRHPGGRSPFMRRWRAGLAGDKQPSVPGWPESAPPVRDGACVGVGGVDVAAALPAGSAQHGLESLAAAAAPGGQC
jgi:hypothetical protein